MDDHPKDLVLREGVNYYRYIVKLPKIKNNQEFPFKKRIIINIKYQTMKYNILIVHQFLIP